MEREVIELTEYEIAPILDKSVLKKEKYTNPEKKFIDLWSNFVEIQNVELQCDYEFGYSEIEVVVRRVSDGKYFKGCWDRCFDREDVYYCTLEQTYPIIRRTISYE